MTKKLLSDDFKIPLQGKYLSDVANMKTDYNSQHRGSAIAADQISDNNKREK